MSTIVGATVHIAAATSVGVVGVPFVAAGQRMHAVRIGDIGCDVRITATADEFRRLADACESAVAALALAAIPTAVTS